VPQTSPRCLLPRRRSPRRRGLSGEAVLVLLLLLTGAWRSLPRVVVQVVLCCDANNARSARQCAAGAIES
jgi:hypothetical protein